METLVRSTTLLVSDLYLGHIHIHSLLSFHISTAKMGLVGFSHTLSLEGAKYNIFSNAIVPIAYSRMSASVMAPRKIYVQFCIAVYSGTSHTLGAEESFHISEVS